MPRPGPGRRYQGHPRGMGVGVTEATSHCDLGSWLGAAERWGLGPGHPTCPQASVASCVQVSEEPVLVLQPASGLHFPAIEALREAVLSRALEGMQNPCPPPQALPSAAGSLSPAQAKVFRPLVGCPPTPTLRVDMWERLCTLAPPAGDGLQSGAHGSQLEPLLSPQCPRRVAPSWTAPMSAASTTPWCWGWASSSGTCAGRVPAWPSWACR